MSRSTQVLFLDEPTSGLDPRASQEIVSLPRRLADAGRMVFLVTHDLTPEVMAQVDHLLVMAPGGGLRSSARPSRPPGTSVCRQQTPPGRFKGPIPPESGPGVPLSAGHRNMSPAVSTCSRCGRSPSRTRTGRTPRAEGGVHQLWTLTTRYAREDADRTGLLVTGLQPPVLAAVMLIVYPKPIVSMFFMITLSCLWLGCLPRSAN